MKSAFDSPLNVMVQERLAGRLQDSTVRELERDFLAEVASFPYRLSARPLLIGSDEWDSLAHGLEELSQALEHVAVLYAAHQEVRDLFDMYAEFEPWILDYTSTSPLVHVCRFDGVWHGGGDFTVMETNAGGPGGVVHIPMGTRQWATTEWARFLTNGLTLDPYPMLRDPYWFAREMLASAARHGHDVSAAAIVKLGDAVSYDIDYIVGTFRDLGCDSDICDARDFVERHGVPVVDGRKYQLIYSKFVPFDVLSDPAAADFVRLFRRDRAFFVNSALVQTIMEDKAVLAVLSDPVFAPLFSARHRSTIERHIPWTRLVESRRTTDPDGRAVDLLEYIVRNRGRLVLKPAHLYAGIDVTVGPYVSDRQWWTALGKALKGRYVVQEYLSLPKTGIPAFGGPGMDEAYSDFSCFMVEGRLAGVSSRSSVKPVVNIGAGGVARIPVIRVSQASATSS